MLPRYTGVREVSAGRTVPGGPERGVRTGSPCAGSAHLLIESASVPRSYLYHPVVRRIQHVPTFSYVRDGRVLAGLGGVYVAWTLLAVPNLPADVERIHLLGLLLSGLPGAVVLFGWYYMRDRKFSPPGFVVTTKRTLQGIAALFALLTVFLVSPEWAPERGLAWVRAYTGVGLLVGFLIGLNEARAIEERHAAEVARERGEQLDFLVHVLRHDVLNKVAVMRGNAELLVERLDESDLRRYARAIEAETHDVESLVEDVRVLAETLEEPTDLAPVDLSSVLAAEAETVRDSYDVTIDVDVPPGSTVLADELVSSLFGNLLRNAAEHGGASPTVSVTAEVVPGDRVATGPASPSAVATDADPMTVDPAAPEASGEAVAVRVADDGPGVPESARDELFEPSTGGSGLGLYIVRTLAERYGGAVRLEDVDEPGATVVVTLLRATSQPADEGPRGA